MDGQAPYEWAPNLPAALPSPPFAVDRRTVEPSGTLSREAPSRPTVTTAEELLINASNFVVRRSLAVTTLSGPGTIKHSSGRFIAAARPSMRPLPAGTASALNTLRAMDEGTSAALLCGGAWTSSFRRNAAENRAWTAEWLRSDKIRRRLNIQKEFMSADL